MQKSMSLKYEPSLEPQEVGFGSTEACVAVLEKGIQTPMVRGRST